MGRRKQNHARPPRSARTPRRSLALVLLLVANLFLWSCTKAPRERVVFVGVDGATWKVIGPLMDAGKLPNFQRMVREGAYMPEFGTMNTTRSPAVWTSVATGRLPKDHGINWYTQKIAGKQVAVTSDERKVKAIWNVATDNGLTVGVIGWWATWPAEPVSGYMITDQANPAAVNWLWPRLGGKDAQQLTRREFSPPDLAPVLAKHWFEPDQYPYAEMQRRGGFTAEQMALVKKADWKSKDPYSWLKISFAVDYPLAELARDLTPLRPVDLQLLYLRGPDPVQHEAWNLVEPERYPEKPEHMERDRGIVEGIYRYVDSFLGEIIAANDVPGTTIIVASDHGAEPCPPVVVALGRPGCHSTEAKGVLMIRGDHVKKNHVLHSGTPIDLMPTMAWLAGLPIADDVAGSVLSDAFEPGYVADRPVRHVASYGPRKRPTPGGPSAADPVLMERLRSLGYIKDN